jgi:homogentisate 1,2-dioxygenase
MSKAEAEGELRYQASAADPPAAAAARRAASALPLMQPPPAPQSGFGNEFASEALPGALPLGQNNPRVCPYGLYAEQITGSAFTAPRATNRRSWLYRILPSVTHAPFAPLEPPHARLTADFSACAATPNQLRWRPQPLPAPGVDFVRGLTTVCGAGSAATRSGAAVHLYAASTDMTNSCLANADGDLLLVPQLGALFITTEFGRLRVAPGEVAVLPRGARFSVALPDGAARGCECSSFSLDRTVEP